MNKKILDSLKAARKKAGLTQVDVEQELGLRKLMLKDYETGRLKLPIEVAIKLADLYRISMDELINRNPQSSELIKLETLFEKDRLDIIFLDPIIRSYIEGYADYMFTASIYEILILNLNDVERKQFSKEMMKYLYSLLGADNKVLSPELNFINSINKTIKGNYTLDKFEKYIHELYLPNDISPVLKKNLPLKHFIIWVMFFLAKSDSRICAQEVQYIEKIAESFKILKTNYLFIHDKFLEEELK